MNTTAQDTTPVIPAGHLVVESPASYADAPRTANMHAPRRKLIIQIPAYNEADNLPTSLSELPREIPGIDIVEVLVIDDGSTDSTSDVAKAYGADHVVRFKINRGLAAAFAAGISKCIKLGADIIVNTDADNQYCAADIVKLVTPILEGHADVVVGDRNTDSMAQFGWLKKKLQRFGTRMVSKIARVPVNDAVSGFRAYGRDAFLRLNVLTDFSYTIETLVQAGHLNLKVLSVPIRTNKECVRKSRLARSMWHFVTFQIKTILRTYTTYNPFRSYTLVSLLMLVPGAIGIGRFVLLFYILHQPVNRFQSLVISIVLIAIGVNILITGLLADSVSSNRKLLEKIILKMREQEDSSARNGNGHAYEPTN